MGQDVSKTITPSPLTFLDCLVNDQIDLSRYLFYRRRQDFIMQTAHHKMMLSKKRKRQYLNVVSKKRQKRHRSVKKHKLLVRDKDGSLRELLPTDTLWYPLYISNPPIVKGC